MLNMVIKQMFSLFTIEVAFGWFQNSKHLSIVDTLIAFRNFLWSIFYSILKVVNRLFQLVWNDVIIIKWVIQLTNLKNFNSERLKYFDRNSFQNDWCCIKIILNKLLSSIPLLLPKTNWSSLFRPPSMFSSLSFWFIWIFFYSQLPPHP